LQGQYRLGTSLTGLGRHSEALASFCKAFDVAEVSAKKDIVLQILSAAEKLSGMFINMIHFLKAI
jgi:hypothetical protein